MSWSLSKVQTYEQCPAKYKFRYLLRSPEGQKSGAASRGVTLHKAVEDFVKGETKELPQEINFYEQFLTGLVGKGFPEHKIALDKDWKLTSWEEGWAKSVLDFKYVNGAEARIYDWKSGKIYDNHDDQKDLYSVFVFAEEPEVTKITFDHVYIDLGKTRSKIYHRPDAQPIMERWEKRVYFMEKDETHIPNPNFGCRFCPYSRTVGGPCRF